MAMGEGGGSLVGERGQKQTRVRLRRQFQHWSLLTPLPPLQCAFPPSPPRTLRPSLPPSLALLTFAKNPGSRSNIPHLPILVSRFAILSALSHRVYKTPAGGDAGVSWSRTSNRGSRRICAQYRPRFKSVLERRREKEKESLGE